MKKFIQIMVWVLLLISLKGNTVLASWWLRIPTDSWWINVAQTNNPNNEDPEALYIIITVINRILSLTSVLAIIIFLIWWYKVLTAWWDDTKAKSWYKIIKNAIIWLLIIWLTRAIIRFIFWFVNWMDWGHDFYIGTWG